MADPKPFAHRLLELFNEFSDMPEVMTVVGSDWSGATKDLLLAYGLEFDPTTDEYRLPDEPKLRTQHRIPLTYGEIAYEAFRAMLEVRHPTAGSRNPRPHFDWLRVHMPDYAHAWERAAESVLRHRRTGS